MPEAPVIACRLTTAAAYWVPQRGGRQLGQPILPPTHPARSGFWSELLGPAQRPPRHRRPRVAIDRHQHRLDVGLHLAAVAAHVDDGLLDQAPHAVLLRRHQVLHVVFGPSARENAVCSSAMPRRRTRSARRRRESPDRDGGSRRTAWTGRRSRPLPCAPRAPAGSRGTAPAVPGPIMMIGARGLSGGRNAGLGVAHRGSMMRRAAAGEVVRAHALVDAAARCAPAPRRTPTVSCSGAVDRAATTRSSSSAAQRRQHFEIGVERQLAGRVLLQQVEHRCACQDLRAIALRAAASSPT